MSEEKEVVEAPKDDAPKTASAFKVQDEKVRATDKTVNWDDYPLN